MSVSKETYDAAVAAFAEAKRAAAEIRTPGWTVYEVVQREASPIPAFRMVRQVVENLETAMSTPRDRRSQYFIVEEIYAADGTRYSTTDGKPVEKFSGYGATGWLHDREIIPWGAILPECHDRWFRVRLSDYAEQATVLDGVLRPMDWCREQGRLRGDIRLIFEAGDEEAGCCDGDCCCGDSDTGSEGGESNGYSDDE